VAIIQICSCSNHASNSLRAQAEISGTHHADRIRDDRQARTEAIPRRDDGQLDARDWARVALCRRLLGNDPEPTGTTAVAANPGYAKLFAELGAGSLAVGIALVVLIPFLRKLITDKAETPLIEAATVVPVA
jgi:hypothetical protein